MNNEPLKQIEQALDEYNRKRKRSRCDDLSDLQDFEATEMLAILSATIDRIAPSGSQYKNMLDAAIKTVGANNAYNIPCYVGILNALKKDIESGFLQKAPELIHADIFTDFIEMSEYLLSEGYKDPSAVLIGGVLEEHLRKLCKKNNIPILDNSKYIKADKLNSELAGKKVYDKLDQKNITSWLDLRNKAAHGEYSKYTSQDVNYMMQGVKLFLSKYMA
jgi:hypothetical protein